MKRFLTSSHLPVILGPVLLFAPTLIAGKALFWGTPSTQFVPWWDFAWEAVLSGQAPFWNPWVGLGAPLAANYQSALFYPPNWLLLALHVMGGVSWMAWGITLLVVFHLCWGGVGLTRLAKELGLGYLGQTVSGLAFALSGYLVARAGFLSITATVAWLPWVMVYTKQIGCLQPRSVLKTAVVVGLMLLGGHAQTAWYGILLGAIWILFWGTREADREAGVRRTLKALGNYLAAGMLGAGISAVQLLPTLEYLLVSSRSAEYGFAEAMTYSFWPWRFLTLFVPNLFGSPADGNYWGYGNYWEDAVYIGLLPILLALGAILGGIPKNPPKDRDKVLVRILTAIAAVSFLLALGKNTPVFPFLYRNIPSFNLFQAPTRFSIWGVFSLSVLAGLGAERLDRPEGKRLYWLRLSVAGCAAILAGAFLAWKMLPGVKTTFISSVGMAGLWGLGSALLLLFKPGTSDPKRSAIWTYSLVVWIGIDLLVAGWGLNPAIAKEFYDQDRSQTFSNRLVMPSDQEYNLKFEKFFRFDAFDTGQEWDQLFVHLLPNAAMLKRVEMVNNFDPIIPDRFQRWMDKLNLLASADLNSWKDKQVVDLMALGGISLAGPDLVPAITIWKAEPIERVRVYACAGTVPSEQETLALMFAEQVDLESILLLEGTAERIPESCPQVPDAALRNWDEGPGFMKASLDLKETSWVFWSQSWYPGWVVSLDGAKVGPSLRADYLFQAAEVPPGLHQVEFRYRPLALLLGAILTGLAGLGVALGWLLTGAKAPAAPQEGRASAGSAAS